MTRRHTEIDPRGPRFAAALTTAVLAAAILLKSPGLVGAQAAIFALGAAALSPYQWLFKALIRPRLAPPGELESASPTRFAQAVGLVFAVVGSVGFATGATVLGFTFTGFALAAAFLNAAFGLCLGCQLYLLLARATGRPLSRRVRIS